MYVTKKQLREDLILIVVAVILVLTFGATVFHLLEGWSVIDSIYFVTMTATTVGYGDFTPTKGITKVITIVYSLSIVPFVLYAFSYVAKTQVHKVYTKIHHLEKQQRSQEEELESTARKIKSQKAKIKEQEKELEVQKRKLHNQAKINKEQETEISEHDKELEVVETIMEKQLTK